MKHGKKFNHLSRKTAHRKAMLSNMASSLILHKRISTTVAKAKALRKYVEPIITRAKSDTTHSRRVVFSYLKHKEPVKELFSTVADKIGDRPGGYTRILKTGTRLGDNAETCIIELVDFNEIYLKKDKLKPGKKRTRRGGKKTITQPIVEDVKVKEAKVEETKDEELEVAEKKDVVDEEKTNEKKDEVIEKIEEDKVGIKDADEVEEVEPEKSEEPVKTTEDKIESVSEDVEVKEELKKDTEESKKDDVKVEEVKDEEIEEPKEDPEKKDENEAKNSGEDKDKE